MRIKRGRLQSGGASMLSQSGITLRTGGYASGSLSAEPIPNRCCICRSDYAHLCISGEISGGGASSTTQAIETGRARPQHRIVQVLAEMFDVPIAQRFAGDLWCGRAGESVRAVANSPATPIHHQSCTVPLCGTGTEYGGGNERRII